MAKLVVVDGTAYIFRAYYGVRPLSTSSGEPTNAVYGVATMLEKTIREEQPEYLAITFDTGARTFRSDIYEDYKAHRPPPPEDLLPQFDRVRELAEALSIPTFSVPGVEADDVIATLVARARAEDFEVCIISGDKDLMQLVGPGVTVYEPMRVKRYGPAEVEEKMGVPPALVADSLALAGDTSDNIPGVRGIGPKTAAKLLLAHGSLDAVLDAAAAGGVKGKNGERLVEMADLARLSRRLVALKDDVSLDLDGMASLRYSGPDKGRLAAFYQAMEFRRLADAAATPEAGDEVAPSGDRWDTSAFGVLGTASEQAAFARTLEAADGFAVTVELSSGHLASGRLLGLGLRVDGAPAQYVPLPPDPADARAALLPFAALLADPDRPKWTDSAKLLQGALDVLGLPVAGVSFDSAVAAYLIDSDALSYDYEILAPRYLGPQAASRSTARTEGKKKVPIDALPVEKMAPLAAERAEVCFRLRPVLLEALTQTDQVHVLRDLELPLARVLARMELRGIPIDIDRLSSMSERFGKMLAELEARCHELAGKAFNVGSPKQLQKILFEELKLKIVKRTKTGPSTDQSVLEVLADAHPLPQAILEYRQVQKLKSTYVDALPKLVEPRTGRVHTIFNQTTAATGRLSSTDPNLQNIPIRSELGRELRKVFVAAEGHRLISVDYSQIELRVLAHLCQDEVLCQAFRDGADVHRRTASVLFEVPESEVSREQRAQAKAVNFGVLYGMGPVRLSRELKIPRRTASKFVEDYFERQPGVRQFMDQTLEFARAEGHVITVLGRRRNVPDIDSKNRGTRAAAERVAINTPVQGSAADLMKLAMLRVDANLAEAFPDARVLLQVHDELLVEAPVDQAEAVAEAVRHDMEAVYPLDVPLVAEAHVGATWDEAH